MRKFVSFLIIALFVCSVTAIIPKHYNKDSLGTLSIKYITKFSNAYTKHTNIITTTENTIKTRQVPFTIKVLFDESHGQYFDHEKLSEFISDLENTFNVNITINTEPLTSNLLSQFDALIITNPGTNFTDEEINSIKEFINNGGIVLISGTWYRYFEPGYVNCITKDYGVDWYDGSINDPTNYDDYTYYPIVHMWAKTDVGQFVSNNGTFLVRFSGTALKIIGANDSTKKIYVVGHGDDDTYVYLEDGTTLDLHEDTLYFIAIDVCDVGGRLFLSGSSDVFQKLYLYDNKDFAMRVFHWLIAEGLEIVNYEVPAEPVLSGEYAYLNVTIRNNAETAATNVHVGIELEGTVELVNESSDVIIGDLEPGAEKTICWVVKSTGTSIAKAKFKVWSDSVFGFSIVGSFKTLGLVVTASLLYNWTVLTSWDWTILTVNVSNPVETGITATNVNVSIHILCFFGSVTTENDSWEYTIAELPYGSYKVLTWKLFASNFEMRENVIILIYIESNELGTTETRVVWIVFTDKFVIFDQGHGQYWDSEMLATFVSEIYGALYFKTSYGNLFINNGSFTENLLGNATAVILPDIGDGMTIEEILLLREFIDKGGRLLIMGNFHILPKYPFFPETEQEIYNNITRPYGITWNIGEIWDNDSNMGAPCFPILTKDAFADNPIAKAILFGVDQVYFPGGTFLTIDANKAVPILLGNPTSYTVNASGLPAGINGTDIIAMAAYYNETTGALVIASGSSAMFGEKTGDTYPAEENAFLLFKIALTLLLYPDTELPTIQITAPENNTWFNTKTVTVSWLGLDNVMIAMYEVYVDGTLEASLPMINMSYTLTLDEGHHTIQVRAYDWCGNSASDEIVVHVDITPPSITITSPKFEETFEMDGSVSVKVEWNASDNLALDHFVIYLNGTKVNEVNSTVRTYTLTLNETGAYYIKVEAWDKAGNSAYSEVLIYVKPKPVTPIWIYITIGVVVVAVIAVAVFLLKRKGKV